MRLAFCKNFTETKNRAVCFFLLCAVSAVLSCASEPDTGIKDYTAGIRNADKETVVVNYNISDSGAFSLVNIWILEQFKNGVNRLDVNDNTNGIITGTGEINTFDITRSMSFRIFIKNGNATLHIDQIQVSGSVYAESLESANQKLELLFFRWKENIKKSFQNIFQENKN